MSIIGIDLGNSFSCMGVWQNGNVVIIANDQGKRTMPSIVAFTDSERLIGDGARNQVALNPVNTVVDVKRIIGRKFDDPNIQENLRHWAFKIISECRKPKIIVESKGEPKKFSAEEITSMILIKMKETAEAYLGTPVVGAVISVPAYFNDSQRQATKDAGTIAGLNVLRLINEPTAAALAYGIDKDLQGERNVLIFDLGGATLDASIITIVEGALFEVKATNGDSYLGGQDFDNRLVDYLAAKFEGRHHKDLRTNPRAFRRLRTAAERTKRILSSCTEASIEIDALFEGIDFYTRVSRARFEELNADLLRRTVKIVENLIDIAKMDKYLIHEVLLVGGATRIPKIQQLLQGLFGRSKVNLCMNPDEAVACGATIQAAILSGEQHTKVNDMLVVDVAPFSIGIETPGGSLTKMMDRNRKIPCKQTQGFTTCSDNQPTITITAYEGEDPITRNNNLMGTFVLTSIPPAPRTIPQIKVMFNLDVNGILKVTARDYSMGFSRFIFVRTDKGRLSQMDIDRMVADAVKYKLEDKRQRETITVRNQLQSYMFSVKQAVDEAGNELSEEEKNRARRECEGLLRWLDNRTYAQKEDYEYQQKEFQKVCDPIMAKTRDALIRTVAQAAPPSPTVDPNVIVID